MHGEFADSSPNGPSWLTFIAQSRDSLWSVDLFRCESILLHSYWVMVVLDVFTRRIIGFGVGRADIDGIAVCRMFNQAIAGQPLPKRISTDHDPLFRFHRWLANLRVLEIDEIKTVPHVPVSHPLVERLIGTIRRELLDRLFFWNALDLERKLQQFGGITTKVAFSNPSAGIRRWNRPASRVKPVPRLIDSDGRSIAEDCSRRRSQPEYEFAMHRLPAILSARP